jgi:hypothetical protein
MEVQGLSERERIPATILGPSLSVVDPDRGNRRKTF